MKINPAVYGIVFHPDLIRGTSLGKDIKEIYFLLFAQSNRRLYIFQIRKKKVVMMLKKNQYRTLSMVSIKHSKSINRHEYRTVTELLYAFL